MAHDRTKLMLLRALHQNNREDESWEENSFGSVLINA